MRYAETSEVDFKLSVDGEEYLRMWVDWQNIGDFPYDQGPEDAFVPSVFTEKKIDGQWQPADNVDGSVRFLHSGSSSTINFSGSGFDESASEGFFIGSVYASAIAPDISISSTGGHEDPAYDAPTAGPQPITITVRRTGAPTNVPVTVRLSDPAPPDPNVGFPSGPDPMHYDTAVEGADFHNSPRSVTIQQGMDEATVVIAVVDDTEVEAVEAFTLYVEPPVPGQDKYAFFADPANPPATKPAIGDNDWMIDSFKLNFEEAQWIAKDDGTGGFQADDWFDDDGDGEPDTDPHPVSYA